MSAPFSCMLFDLLREQAERFPDHIAVISGERAATYRDLADGAGRIGAGLSAHGIGRGDRVGILINNCLEWLEACFGAAASGAVAVPFSTWSKPDELAYLLADSAVTAMIAVDRFAGQDFRSEFAASTRLLLPIRSALQGRPWQISSRTVLFRSPLGRSPSCCCSASST